MPATKLTQTHFFFGDTNTFCRPDAVRIDNLGPMHFSVVAKAPKWTVTVFRDDDKSCFVETIHSLEVNGLMNDYVMHRQDHAKYQDQKPGEIIVNNFKVKQVSGKSEYIAYLPIDKVASPRSSESCMRRTKYQLIMEYRSNSSVHAAKSTGLPVFR